MDIEGKTALFYAKIAGHKEIEELLNQQNSNSNQFDDNQSKTSLGPKNAVNNNNHQNSNNNENIALNLNYIENFNKLPASII